MTTNGSLREAPVLRAPLQTNGEAPDFNGDPYLPPGAPQETFSLSECPTQEVGSQLFKQ